MKNAREKEKSRKSSGIPPERKGKKPDKNPVKTSRNGSRKNSAKNFKGKIRHEKTYSVLTGVFAGLVNGVFGGGGGMIVVPMLVYLLKKEPKVAHATAILLILPMSITSGLFYAAFGSFRAEAGIPVTIGVVAGGILGALLLGKMSSKFIVALFSAVMAAAGVKMLFF